MEITRTTSSNDARAPLIQPGSTSGADKCAPAWREGAYACRIASLSGWKRAVVTPGPAYICSGPTVLNNGRRRRYSSPLLQLQAQSEFAAVDVHAPFTAREVCEVRLRTLCAISSPLYQVSETGAQYRRFCRLTMLVRVSPRAGGRCVSVRTLCLYVFATMGISILIATARQN